MKPSWKDAPEWAQYLAMDEDGHWLWYANEPEIREGCEENLGGWDLNPDYAMPSPFEIAGIGTNWRKSLERRHMSEEDFLSIEIPFDIKIGSGTNKAGTTIKALLHRIDTVNMVLEDYVIKPGEKIDLEEHHNEIVYYLHHEPRD